MPFSVASSPGTDTTATPAATSGLLSICVGTVSPASAMTAKYDFKTFDFLEMSTLVAAPIGSPSMTTTVATVGYY